MGFPWLCKRWVNASGGQLRGRSFWVTRGGIAVHKQTPHPARFLVDTGDRDGRNLWEYPCNILWLVVWNIFYFSIYWEKSYQLTNIFQRGWNHQPGLIVTDSTRPTYRYKSIYLSITWDVPRRTGFTSGRWRTLYRARSFQWKFLSGSSCLA